MVSNICAITMQNFFNSAKEIVETPEDLML